MSVAVCIHKCIRNGYIETVTCILQRLCLLLSGISRWIIKFIYERDVNIAFSTWRKQGRRERERESTLIE